jgi:hypothetical protein
MNPGIIDFNSDELDVDLDDLWAMQEFFLMMQLILEPEAKDERT